MKIMSEKEFLAKSNRDEYGEDICALTVSINGVVRLDADIENNENENGITFPYRLELYGYGGWEIPLVFYKDTDGIFDIIAEERGKHVGDIFIKDETDAFTHLNAILPEGTVYVECDTDTEIAQFLRFAKAGQYCFGVAKRQRMSA